MTEHVGAAPYERSEKRTGQRNGYKPRTLRTRVGTLNLLVPQDREGTFSTRLFSRYQRNEKALVLALMEMYVEGVSTRKVKDVTEELCGTSFSKSLVSSAGRLAWTRSLGRGGVGRWRPKATPTCSWTPATRRSGWMGRVVSQGVLVVSAVRRRRAAGDPRRGGRRHRERGDLPGAVPLAEEPGPQGRRAGGLRRPRGPQRRPSLATSRALPTRGARSTTRGTSSGWWATPSARSSPRTSGRSSPRPRGTKPSTLASSVAEKWRAKGNEKVAEHLEEHIEECLILPGLPGEPPQAHPHHQRSGEAQPGDKAPNAGG